MMLKKIIYNKTQYTTDDVLRWFLESKNKHYSKSSERRKNYNVKEFCSNQIDQRLRLPIAKVLDPLAEWVKDTSKHYLTNLQCLNKDYLTLFPTSWISTTILDEYIRYLSHQYSSRFHLVRISDLVSLTNDKEKLNNYSQQFLNKDVHFVFLFLTNNNHYVTVEIPAPSNQRYQSK